MCFPSGDLGSVPHQDTGNLVIDLKGNSDSFYGLLQCWLKLRRGILIQLAFFLFGPCGDALGNNSCVSLGCIL